MRTYAVRTAALTVLVVMASTGVVAVGASPAMAAAPVVSSFSPASGAIGTRVTVTGSGFRGATEVAFGGRASHFTVKSGTKIVVTTPGHAAGTVDVRVITKFGASAITSHDRYKFT